MQGQKLLAKKLVHLTPNLIIPPVKITEHPLTITTTILIRISALHKTSRIEQPKTKSFHPDPKYRIISPSPFGSQN